MTLREFVAIMSSRTGKYFTEEQFDFLQDFTSPQISFSMPGTGKTHSSVAGLLVAELYHGIPGNKIFALSFTRLATGELKTRHDEMCKKLGVMSTVQFRTLHSICRKILFDDKRLMDLENLEFKLSASVEEMGTFLLEKSQDLGISVSPYKVRSLVKAIRQLNASLIFDRAHVESKMEFRQTGLSYEDFTLLRRAVYTFNMAAEEVHMDDLLLFTLQLLLENPEQTKRYRDNIKLILVDEFQDMSLLQLRVLSLLTDNLVVIGDINQQIYAFNGACQEIVAKYLEYYPNARVRNLTQSFRCANKIADFATKIILPNDKKADAFKGNGEEGILTVGDNLNVTEVVDQIQADFLENRNIFPKSIMFLFRNNYSVVPLADVLYKKRLPFRVSSYKPAHQIPVVGDIVKIIELALHPECINNIGILRKLMPEFARYDNVASIPLARILAKQGGSIFDINYQFENEGLANQVFTMLQEVAAMESQGVLAFDLFARVYPLYNKLYLEDHAHFLEQPPEYYTQLVSTLIRTKTYREFITDEISKMEYIKDCVAERTGIRCYTFHAAKGTEADIVHIIDADEGIVPSLKKLDDMKEKKCLVDAAREVHNERCLAYVAATRAHEELHIWYSHQLAGIFVGTDAFAGLDLVYENRDAEFNDVEEFEKFYKGA